MIYTLIKAKSGLHAGATWCFEHSITLGANGQADVFLCDPGIPDTLVTLRKAGRRFYIENLHKDAIINSADQKKIDNILFPNQSVSLDFKHIQLEINILNSANGLLTALTDNLSRVGHAFTRLVRGLGTKAIVGLLFLVGLLLTTMILFFGTAGVVQSEASVMSKAQAKADATDQEAAQNKAIVQVASLEDRMSQNVADEMKVFAQRANAQYLDIKVDGTKVNIDTELSRAQAVEFERELVRVSRDYGDKVEIMATLQLTEEQKKVDAIDIEQVILGTRPVIILRDGARLYLGANYEGLNVVSIDSRKVTLKGSESVYEVNL